MTERGFHQQMLSQYLVRGFMQKHAAAIVPRSDLARHLLREATNSARPGVNFDIGAREYDNEWVVSAYMLSAPALESLLANVREEERQKVEAEIEARIGLKLGQGYKKAVSAATKAFRAALEEE